MKIKFSKAKKPILKILPAKPKGRNYQMTLNEAKEETYIASGILLLNRLPANILFDSESYHSFISNNLVENLNVHHIDKILKYW